MDAGDGKAGEVMFEGLGVEKSGQEIKSDFPRFFDQLRTNGNEAAEHVELSKTDGELHSDFPQFFEQLRMNAAEHKEYLTEEEKIKKQDEVIDDVESGRKSLDSTQEKGNYGEMKTDQDMREKGFVRISQDMVTDLDESGHQGIDGVYHNPQTGEYIIIDSKFGTAQLGDTQDGKQMCADWINSRLDAAVGKEKADEIRMKMLFEPDKVKGCVAHVETGKVTYDRLDSNANIVEKDVKIN